MAIYNVSKIENWYDDFTSCKNKFLNTYAEDYQNSYIKECKDDIANKMRVSLNDNYNRINRLYNNINNFWNNYLNDLKNTDNCLAGTTSAGSVNSSIVSAKLKALPELVEYKVNMEIRTSSFATNTKNWWNNNKDTMAVYGFEIFCDVIGLVDDFADGLFYAVGTIYTEGCTLVGEEDEAQYAEEWYKEAISMDWETESKEGFYSTELGKEINANSKVKYDSDTMSNFSEGFTKWLNIGVSIGIGIGSKGGGVAGVFGGVMGGGNSVEAYLSENPEASLTDAFGSALVGGLKKGSEYYANASIASGGLSFFKNIKNIFSSGSGTSSVLSTLQNAFTKQGAKENFSNVGTKLSEMFSKSNLLKSFGQTFKEFDTWADSLGIASDHIKIDSKTGDAYIDDWSEFFEDASFGFLLNFVFNIPGVSSKGTSSSVMDDLTNDLKKEYGLDDLSQKGLKNASPSGASSKSSLRNKVDEIIDSAKKSFDDFKTNNSARITETKSKVSDWFTNLKTSFDDTTSKLSNRIHSVLDNIKPNKTSIDDVISSTGASRFNNSDLNIDSSNMNGNPDHFEFDWKAKKEADKAADALKNADIPILEKYKVDTSSSDYQNTVNNYKNIDGTEGLLGKENPFKKNNSNTNVSTTKTSLRNKVDEIIDSAKKSFDDFKTGNSAKIAETKSNVSDWFINLKTNLDDTTSKLSTKIHSVLDDISIKKPKTNSLDEVFGNGKSSSNVIDENTYNSLLKRRDELLAETKKDWFKQVEEYTYSGYAQSFDDVIRHDEILEQINNIDNTLRNNNVVKNIELSETDYAIKQNYTQNLNGNGINFKTDLNYDESSDFIRKRINDLEETFGLDYNDKIDRNIIDSIVRLYNLNPSDVNVGKIINNIETIIKKEPKFTYLIDKSGNSAFWGPNKSILLSENLLEHSAGVIGQTNMHEMGHAYLHIFNGSEIDGYKLLLSDETQNIIESSIKNLQKHPEIYMQYLEESNKIYDLAVKNTEKWWDGIRIEEKIRIEKLIDDLYSEGNSYELKKGIENSKNLQQVKNILSENGLSIDNIDEILKDKELVKQISVMQNAVNKQQTYLDELMGTYDNYGDYRKISAIINSATQQTEHIDPITGNKLSCPYGHSNNYWKNNPLIYTYDELCADYFSLAAHGRDKVIKIMENIIGEDLMNSIKGEYKKIADSLEKQGLIKY